MKPPFSCGLLLQYSVQRSGFQGCKVLASHWVIRVAVSISGASGLHLSLVLSF